MNVNNSIQQNNNPAQLRADYKRIIETRHNLNTPRTPSLLKFSEVYSAIANEEFLARLKIFNPTPNDFVESHQ
jgi:hypothetical protein